MVLGSSTDAFAAGIVLLPISKGILPTLARCFAERPELLLEELGVSYLEQRFYPPLMRRVLEQYRLISGPEFGALMEAEALILQNRPPNEALALLNRSVNAQPDELLPRTCEVGSPFKTNSTSSACPTWNEHSN